MHVYALCVCSCVCVCILIVTKHSTNMALTVINTVVFCHTVSYSMELITKTLACGTRPFVRQL